MNHPEIMRALAAWPTPAQSFDKAVDDQITIVSHWLRVYAPQCSQQKLHLVEGSDEEAYYLYGRLAALLELRRLHNALPKVQ